MKKMISLFVTLMMLFTMTAMADAVASPDARDMVLSPDTSVVLSPEAYMVPSPDAAEIKVGQVLWADYDNKSFSIITVLMYDDVIVDAHIDEYQLCGMTVVLVPENDFADIEAFVIGMTIADLEVTLTDMVAEYTEAPTIDVVFGVTLNYLEGLLAAAKAAQ